MTSRYQIVCMVVDCGSLKRAADELGGLYISFTDLAEQNPGMIQDGAHPSVAGHRLVARRICEKLGLPMPE